MRYGQIESIFSSFRQDAGKSIGDKVLEFVDIQIEVLTTLFRNTHTFHGSKLNFGNDHTSEQSRVVFTDATLRNVYQENLAFVHHVENIDGALRLTDDIANDRSGEKLSDFVLNRRDSLVSKFILPCFVLVYPKSLDDRIFQIADNFLTIIFVDEHARNTEKRRPWSIE